MTTDMLTGALAITLLALALWMILALTVDAWGERTAQILTARVRGRQAWREAYRRSMPENVLEPSLHLDPRDDPKSPEFIPF